MSWASGSSTPMQSMKENWSFPNLIRVRLDKPEPVCFWFCWFCWVNNTCCFYTLASLAVEYTWDTQCPSRDAEGAFLICGTLYVVYNTRYGGRSTVQCLYDIHNTIHR